MDNKPWVREGLTQKEYEMIVDLLDREPNAVELGMYGVMWSEHCSYKNSKKVLKNFPTKGEQVIQGPGENAGIIDIGDGQAISFKIESHNHPSAIEPYQGAATGIGGIIRDIFTMGARPIACLNSLRFGELEDDRVQYLFEGVVEGIAGYGNCIGIPNVGGEVFFSEAYQDNPLVNAMCVGLMDHDDISTGTAQGVGNPVMVVGAATGRDGIQGASFASDELNEDSEEDRPAVQVGDPFMEKLLLEASLELIKTGALVGIQDMGAAGLTSSSCEMASRGDSGIELDVSLVPKREKGMNPYEVMLSESQERMLVVPKKGKEDLVKEIFNKWGLNAAVIGKVTDDDQLRILDDNQVVAEVPAASLADEAPVYEREAKKPAYIEEKKQFEPCQLIERENDMLEGRSSLTRNQQNEYNDLLLELLGSPNIASKEWVYQQYDYMVRTNTVVVPGSDAAVLRIKGTDKGLAIATDCNGRYCFLDPKKGGEIAVAEAARNIVCSGAKPLAVTDGLNFGNPHNPEIFWQFKKCVEGISKACKELGTPVSGGNVSFYNESPEGAVYPTPIIGMVGLLDDVTKAVTQEFKDKGDLILLLGETKVELGGSEYLNHFYDTKAGEIPELNLEKEKRVQQVCLEAAEKGILKSAHDCSEGGLAVNLAESCIGGDLGAVINDSLLDQSANKPQIIGQLFSETQSRIVISISPDNLEEIENLSDKYNIKLTELGQVIEDNLIIEDIIDLPIKELRAKWQKAISSHITN